jgi:hypothetical protein
MSDKTGNASPPNSTMKNGLNQGIPRSCKHSLENILGQFISAATKIDKMTIDIR